MMFDVQCPRCRKVLLKTSAISYGQANDSVDGEQQIQCPRCGGKTWLVDRRLVDVLVFSAIGSSHP